MTPAELLAAYDAELRTDAETPSAIGVEHVGPLRLVDFGGGRGFVTYQDLAGADAATIAGWVDQVQEHYRAGGFAKVEWKTRAHDEAPGLHDALTTRGFVEDETESIMIGEAASLDQDVPLPDGVTLRTVTSEADVLTMSRMLDIAFEDDRAEEMTAAHLRRLAKDDGMQLWVAEADGAMVSAGRLEPVAGTTFAGIWGGATLKEWRGQGIYRALTAERARAALAMGKTLINSDSTEYSRPILEKSGLVKVSETTPYVWRPAA